MPKPRTIFRCKNRKAVVVFVSRGYLGVTNKEAAHYAMTHEEILSLGAHYVSEEPGLFGVWLLWTKDELWFTLISYMHIVHSSYSRRKPLSHYEQALTEPIAMEDLLYQFMLSKPSTPVENNLVPRCYNSPQQRYVWCFHVAKHFPNLTGHLKFQTEWYT